MFSKDSKEQQTPQKSSAPTFNPSPKLSFSSLPQVNRARPIGVIRPTPQVGKKDAPKPVQETSPRSKMMPGLAAKVSTISSGGSFSKVVPKGVRQTSNHFNIAPQNGKLENTPKSGRISEKSISEELPIQQVNKPEGAKVKEQKETKPKSTPKKRKASEHKEEETKAKSKDDDTSSKKGLAGRKDVVYKTLLRSVKRYYSTEFENRTEYATLTKSKQEKK